MTWRWLVDDGVEPGPGARDELEAAAALVPDAVLVASHVVGPDGAPDPGSEPWPRILDKPAAIEAARRGLLAVRAVPAGSLLVRGELGERLAAAPPRAVLALTAAALATEAGVLAPRSVAVRAVPVAPPGVRSRLALLRAPFWTREERLWQLFMLARRRRAHAPPSAASRPRAGTPPS